MDFDELPKEEGLCLAIRGHSKHGKTHMANMVCGVERTVVADTHATNSTIETLRKIGQVKFRRVADWSALLRMTDDFVREYEPPAAFILDSGSDMVDMAQNWFKEKTGKQPFQFAWSEVWGYIRNWMNSLTRPGYDLILTSRMKRVYSESTEGGGGGTWTGDWEPAEWKDLDYQLSAGIYLQRGMTIGGRLYFDYRIFPAVMTKDNLVMSRWARLGECKPYIVGPFNRDNILRQIQTPWFGSMRDILNEYWLLLKDSPLPVEKKFVADIEMVMKSNKLELSKDWEEPVGERYSAPMIPVPDVASSGPRAALEEAAKDIKPEPKKEPATGGEEAPKPAPKEKKAAAKKEPPKPVPETPKKKAEPEKKNENAEDTWTI
jgi:hypothetical protein